MSCDYWSELSAAAASARQRATAARPRPLGHTAKGDRGSAAAAWAHGKARTAATYRFSLTFSFDSRLRRSRDTQPDFAAGAKSAVLWASPWAP